MEINISDVTKKFKNNKVLDDISLKIKEGNTALIVGKNGAGKTTLIRLILNLYNVTSGNILVDNINVSSREYDKVKEKIGFLNDNIGLFKEFTAWDNIEFFHRIYFPNATSNQRKIDIEYVLKNVDLYNNRDSKITFFSRGMKQRLAIARAIVNKPKILILDEPSRGLDLEGKEMLKDIIHQYQNDGATILINSHDLDDFQYTATQIAFIKEGKIICEGSYNDLQREFGENIYSLKTNNNSEIKKRLQQQVFVDYVEITKDELIIHINKSLEVLSKWLYQNNVKINELKKVNDTLSYLYKKIIG